MTAPARPGTWPDSYVTAFMRGAAATRRDEITYQEERGDNVMVAWNERKLREIKGV